MAKTIKKKVTKKTAKKVTKKVAKKVVKKVVATPVETDEQKMEREVKESKAFQKKVDTVGKAIVKLAEKHGVKLMVQGYDDTYELGFILGGKVKTDFEARAMESMFASSIKR